MNAVKTMTDPAKTFQPIVVQIDFDLRDYFAAKAMQFELTEDVDYATVARRCYSVADAMIKAKGEA